MNKPTKPTEVALPPPYVKDGADGTLYKVLDREPSDGEYGPVFCTFEGRPFVGFYDNDDYHCVCEMDPDETSEGECLNPDGACHALFVIERGAQAEGMYLAIAGAAGMDYHMVPVGSGGVYALEAAQEEVSHGNDAA